MSAETLSESNPYLAYSVNTFSGCDEGLFHYINLAHQPGLQYISAMKMQPLDYKVGKNLIRRLEMMKHFRYQNNMHFALNTFQARSAVSALTKTSRAVQVSSAFDTFC